MADFDIVDLTLPSTSAPDTGGGPAGTVGGQGVDGVLGGVDSTQVAAQLESLRADLSDHITATKGNGLRLQSLVVRLSISAEGRVAFVAKGAAEASIEVTFTSSE